MRLLVGALPIWQVFFLFFFFNDTATTEIYTLSLHDALPIFNVKDANSLVQDTPVDEETATNSSK